MILKATELKKDFPRSGKSSNFFTAVQPVDLTVSSGEMTVITGKSGSGKSTLLNMLSGMLQPTSGKVTLDETDIYSLDEKTRALLRNEKTGLIPQGNTALLSLSVLENVLLPFVLYHKEEPPAARAKELLDKVGIAELMNEKPGELSGGEFRRMAVARALLMNPGILFADEPTAGLDSENTEAVLSLLRKAADSGAAVLLVTHEDDAAKYADRILTMDGGRLFDTGR
ncbi:MAG: ABC transporter ATP-binding protein [Blautia sp.]|nr:ABC transporter ATP-binding protein [Blautia sp.]